MTSEEERKRRVTAEVVRGGPEIVGDLAPEWRELCDASGDPLPFTRPEWVEAYFRCNDKARRFHILTVRIDGKLKAVLPLIERKHKLSHIPANIFRGPSDFNLWPSDISIAGEPERQMVAKELWGLIRNLGEWDVIELPNIPLGGAAEDFLKAATDDGFPSHRWEYMHSPLIRLAECAGTENPADIAVSSHLRKHLRQIIRKTEKEGGIEVLFSDKFDSALLGQLYEMEASGWKGESGNAILLREKERRFHDEIATAAQNFGYLSLHALKLKGHVVAIALGFNYKKRYFGMKMGWDQNLKSYSLGHLLVHAILNDCLGHGITELHLMGLRSDWKEKWTKNTLPHSTCYIFRKGLYGKVTRKAKLRSISNTINTFSIQSEHLGGEGTG